MAFEITGKLIEMYAIQNVSEKFKKREFVIEYKDNPNMSFSEMLKFQLTQDRCNLIDAFSIGQEVKVSFNLRGRRWEKDGNTSYFTNLEAWKVEGGAASSETSNAGLPQSESIPPLPEDGTNDLPF